MRFRLKINRAHGRALLEGLSDYALERTDWRLEFVDPACLHDAARVQQFDGFVARVMDETAATTLLRSGKPVVDTYGRVDINPLPSIRLDDVAIAELAFGSLAERHYGAFAYCGFPGVRFSDVRRYVRRMDL